MTRLRNVLKKHAPGMFMEGPQERVGRIAEAMLVYHSVRITAELKLPLFGSPERGYVAALAVASREDADGQIAAVFEDELP